MPVRAIGQARKVAVLQGQEVVGEAGKVRGIDEEAANDEDGLIVWPGRVTECTEISGFVDEADVQSGPQKKLWPPDGGHRVCRPRGDRRSRISGGEYRKAPP